MTEQKIDWSKVTYPVAQTATLSISDIKPNYNMTFHKDGKQIGALDWNGPQMMFTGDAEESAKVFFDWVAQAFASRLEQERKRDWVGLTDEEIEDILNNWPTYHMSEYEFARAIEAKLREKNQ